MPTNRQNKLFKQAFASKKAFMPLTDQAMAAQGAPMPPAGAPMDPTMMTQGGAPMPPQGPIQTGDLAIDMLLEMGAMIVDPNGQPVPPEAIAQVVAEINAQTGGQAHPGGAPMGNEEILTTLGQMDKTMALLLDKVDALRDIVDTIMPKKEKTTEDIDKEVAGMDDELAVFLAEQAAQGAQQEPPMEAVPVETPVMMPAGIDPAQAQQLGLIQAMQGVQ